MRWCICALHMGHVRVLLPPEPVARARALAGRVRDAAGPATLRERVPARALAGLRAVPLPVALEDGPAL